MNLGQGDAQAGAGALGRGGHLGHLGVHVQNGVALDVAHAVAAAQVKLPGLVAMGFLHVGGELQHDHCGPFKYVLGKDLGAHVAVEAHQLHMGLAEGEEGDLLGLAGLDGAAEFGVHLAGGDGLIGVGVDAGGQAEQHPLLNAPPGGLRLNGLDLLHVIRHKIADTVIHTVADVLIGLVVAVEVGLAQVVARPEGGVNFAGGHHVDAHALLPHDLIDALEGVGLAGVQGPGAGAEVPAERLGIHPAVGADPVLVHQVEGGAVLPGQLHSVLTGKEQAPVGDGKVVADHVSFPFCFSGRYPAPQGAPGGCYLACLAAMALSSQSLPSVTRATM